MDNLARLVIAARKVAFGDEFATLRVVDPVAAELLKELDEASEAFADQVPWDDQPEKPDA